MNHDNETNVLSASANTTGQSPGRPPPNYSVLPQLIPISVAIVLTNGLVFALFVSRKQLRTPSNFPLLSLAVVDFLTGAVCIPMFALVLIPVRLKSLGNIGYSTTILHNVFAVAAPCHIVVVTMEKYFAIKQPLRHRMLGKKTIGGVLVGVWLVAALVALVPVTWYAKRFQPEFIQLSAGHAIFCLVAVFVVPYSLIMYAQIMTFRTVTKRGLRRLARCDSRVHSRTANHRKCLYIFAAMAAIFAVCWLPWFTITLILSVPIPHNGQTIENYARVFLLVRYSTSIINPLLYTFLKRDFWCAFKNLVGCRTRRLHRRLTEVESLRLQTSRKERYQRDRDADVKANFITERETVV